MGYAGSEEFIRLQFEEYLLSLLAAVKYHLFITTKKDDANQSILEVGKFHLLLSWCIILQVVEGDPTNDYGLEWVKAWMQTENFRLFNKFTGKNSKFC